MPLTIELPGPPCPELLDVEEMYAEIERLGRAGWRSPRGAAEFLGIPKSEVYRLTKAKAVWSFKRGKRLLIPVVELRRYMVNQAMLGIASEGHTRDNP